MGLCFAAVSAATTPNGPTISTWRCAPGTAAPRDSISARIRTACGRFWLPAFPSTFTRPDAVTALSLTVDEPLHRCCICGGNPVPPDYLDIALRTRDETQEAQYLGAHPECLQSVLAPGFTVEIHQM